MTDEKTNEPRVSNKHVRRNPSVPETMAGEPTSVVAVRVPRSVKARYVERSRAIGMKLDHWARVLMDAELQRVARGDPTVTSRDDYES